jgi:hypothetical protein
MDGDLKRDLIQSWRVLGAILIYPMTVAAGLGALLRIVSACCVLLDSWTAAAALSNLALGVPTLAALAALWITTIRPAERLAGNRARFVLAATGLLTGLVLEFLYLRARLATGGPSVRGFGPLDLWTIAGPPAVVLVNLGLLIRAREHAFAASPSPPAAPERRVPAEVHPHSAEVLRPFALRPYRREPSHPAL